MFSSAFPTHLELPEAKGQLRITRQWGAVVSVRTPRPGSSPLTARGPWACGRVETTLALGAILRIKYTSIHRVLRTGPGTGCVRTPLSTMGLGQVSKPLQTPHKEGERNNQFRALT